MKLLRYARSVLCSALKFWVRSLDCANVCLGSQWMAILPVLCDVSAVWEVESDSGCPVPNGLKPSGEVFCC